MTTALDRRIDEVRRFNRFYTRRIGVLDRGLLGSDLTLTEVRVLYELAHSRRTTASELAAALGIDAGYLSRILDGFHRAGYVSKRRAPDDARRTFLTLTASGRRTFAPLDAAAQDDIRAMIGDKSPSDQRRLVAAMRTIASVLDSAARPREVVLREPAPGELGWIVERHGALYAEEYGWGAPFEALVAGVVGRFAENQDPARERCWIADLNGEPVGSILCVSKSKTVAKLRLLIVEPHARSLGIGGRLVDACVAFARGAGYRTMELWTQSVLHAARRIYERGGFELVAQEQHSEFGVELTGETWQLKL